MIFVDTGFLIALFNKRDKDHRRVAEVFQGFKGKTLADALLTTDLVILAIDCVSFVVMEKLGIQEALAVDSDFTHRFIARPGPR